MPNVIVDVDLIISYVTSIITLLDFSPVDFKRFLTVLADRPLFGNHCLFRRGLVANGIRLTKRYSAPFSSCDVTRDLPDLGNSFSVGLVCFLKSPPTTA